MESVNVRIDEKFMIQERIVDYNLDDDVVTKPRNDEVFLKVTTICKMNERKGLNKAQNLQQS